MGFQGKQTNYNYSGIGAFGNPPRFPSADTLLASSLGGSCVLLLVSQAPPLSRTRPSSSAAVLPLDE